MAVKEGVGGGVGSVTSLGGGDAGPLRPLGDGWSISGRLGVKFIRFTCFLCVFKSIDVIYILYGLIRWICRSCLLTFCLSLLERTVGC